MNNLLGIPTFAVDLMVVVIVCSIATHGTAAFYHVLNKHWERAVGQSVIVADAIVSAWVIITIRMITHTPSAETYMLASWFPLVAAAACLVIYSMYSIKRYGLMAIILLFHSPATVIITVDFTPYLHMASQLALCISGFVLFSKVKRFHRNTITAVSIKQTYDNLSDGLMFFDRNGMPTTCNAAMSHALAVCGAKPTDNIDCVWEDLSKPAQKINSRIIDERDIVSLGSDGQYWYFSRVVIPEGGPCEASQIMATEVTEVVRLIHAIEARQQELAESVEEVKSYLLAMKGIEQKRLSIDMRMQIHDVLAQRVSVIRRFLDDGIDSEEHLNQILDILDSIENDLFGVEAAEDMDALLEALIDTYKAAGLTIAHSGTLPEDKKVASVWLAVIREAATNAIVHGNASQMSLHIEEKRLTIRNDGMPSADPVEGSGMRGMRNRLAVIGGMLEVVGSPVFTLVITRR